ncbi:MAG: molecular chaperone DnaJ [Firmicutes bacterium]|nr:molecular chaperone DnaJ [Bacillota bacterium]
MAKNPYDILGVSKSATPDEIKSAYRKLAKQYHPDQNPGNKDAESKFKEISAAYEILGDAGKKANYDRFGSAEGFGGMGGGGQGFGGFEGFEGFDFSSAFGNMGDIFGSMFGGGGGARQRANRGNDIQININISFFEAANGCKKTVTFSRFEKCHDCNGTGAKNGTAVDTCTYCQGRGAVRQTTRLGRFGVMENVVPCTACNATGRVIRDKCGQCSGKGSSKKTVDYDVNVPAGIADGQILNIAGEGDAAQGSEGMSGSLLIGIRVASHPILVRSEFDLHLELPITFTQAILGDTVKIPTIDGIIDFKVPPYTQSGTVHRLKGKGIKRLRSVGSGDLIIKIFVEIPDKVDKRLQEYIRTLDTGIDAREYKKKNTYNDKIKNASSWRS